MSILDKVNYETENDWYRLGNRIAWWDRYQKLWTSYLIDIKGHQKSDTDYAPRKADFQELENDGFLDDACDGYNLNEIKWNKFAFGITGAGGLEK